MMPWKSAYLAANVRAAVIALTRPYYTEASPMADGKVARFTVICRRLGTRQAEPKSSGHDDRRGIG
jgi:hypothetical protein